MNPFVDWQKNVLEHIKGKNLIEFGLGSGTEYLLNHCKTVKSVEVLPTDEWYKKVQSLHKDNPKWKGVMVYHEDRWTKKLEEVVKHNAVGYDVAFVDPGVHCRPEMVNALFGVVDTIFAHDTSFGEEDYHWLRIKEDKRYEKHEFPSGQGTTIWQRLV